MYEMKSIYAGESMWIFPKAVPLQFPFFCLHKMHYEQKC